MIFFKRILMMSVLLLSATLNMQAMFDGCCVRPVEQTEEEQLFALEQELLASWIEPEVQDVMKLFDKKLFGSGQERIDAQGLRYVFDQQRIYIDDKKQNGFAEAFDAISRDTEIKNAIESFSLEQCKAFLSQKTISFYEDKVTPLFMSVISREWGVMLAFGKIMKRLTKDECVEYLNKKFWHGYTVFEFAIRMGRSDSLKLLGLILKDLGLSEDQYLAIFRGCAKSIDTDKLRFLRNQLSLIKALGDVVFSLCKEIENNKKLRESLFFGLLEEQLYKEAIANSKLPYYQRMK